MTDIKIVLPYIHAHGELLTDENFKVYGGIEKHIHNVYKHFNCIPFHISKDEMGKFHKVRERFNLFLLKHKPDLVYTNFIQKSFLTERYPVLQHWHMVPAGGFVHINLVSGYINDKTIFRAGVTDYQQKRYSVLSQRLYSEDIEYDTILPSSFCENDIGDVVEPTYDITTIGRMNMEKNPFLVTNKLDNKFGLSGRVFTPSPESELVILKDKEHQKFQKYYDNNKPIDFIHRMDVPHSDIMEELKEARVLVSTWPDESFGITALEALSRGVPCILVTKGEMGHASEAITPRPEYVKTIDHKAPPEEFYKAFQELAKLDRNKIAEETRNKHSLGVWKQIYNTAFNNAINKHNSNIVSIGDFL